MSLDFVERTFQRVAALVYAAQMVSNRVAVEGDQAIVPLNSMLELTNAIAVLDGKPMLSRKDFPPAPIHLDWHILASGHWSGRAPGRWFGNVRRDGGKYMASVENTDTHQYTILPARYTILETAQAACFAHLDELGVFSQQPEQPELLEQASVS